MRHAISRVGIWLTRQILRAATAWIASVAILYFLGMAALPACRHRLSGGAPSAGEWKFYWLLYRPAFEHQPGQAMWHYVQHTSGMSDLEMFLFVQSVLSDRPVSPATMRDEFHFNIND